MQIETTQASTGADEAADDLAKRLRDAGWEVRVNPQEHPAELFQDGRVMFAARRQVSLHADGPRSAGRPHISAYWFADRGDGTSEPVARFHDADISFAYLDGDPRNLKADAELAIWVDVLLAVTAAVKA